MSQFGAAVYTGPLEVKMNQFEIQLRNLEVKFTAELGQAQNSSQVKAAITDELNNHSRLVNENVK